MKTFLRICIALMCCGALSLAAADGDTASNGGGKGETGGHRGPRRGGKGHVTFLICPNCHHKLVVRAFPGHGPGGKEGRDGEHRGPRRGGKGRRPENRQQQPDTPPQTEEEKTN
jgi:hypothetical protein